MKSTYQCSFVIQIMVTFNRAVMNNQGNPCNILPIEPKPKLGGTPRLPCIQSEEELPIRGNEKVETTTFIHFC